MQRIIALINGKPHQSPLASALTQAGIDQIARKAQHVLLAADTGPIGALVQQVITQGVITEQFSEALPLPLELTKISLDDAVNALSLLRNIRTLFGSGGRDKRKEDEDIVDPEKAKAAGASIEKQLEVPSDVRLPKLDMGVIIDEAARALGTTGSTGVAVTKLLMNYSSIVLMSWTPRTSVGRPRALSKDDEPWAARPGVMSTRIRHVKQGGPDNLFERFELGYASHVALGQPLTILNFPRPTGLAADKPPEPGAGAIIGGEGGEPTIQDAAKEEEGSVEQGSSDAEAAETGLSEPDAGILFHSGTLVSALKDETQFLLPGRALAAIKFGESYLHAADPWFGPNLWAHQATITSACGLRGNPVGSGKPAFKNGAEAAAAIIAAAEALGECLVFMLTRIGARSLALNARVALWALDFFKRVRSREAAGDVGAVRARLSASLADPLLTSDGALPSVLTRRFSCGETLCVLPDGRLGADAYNLACSLTAEAGAEPSGVLLAAAADRVSHVTSQWIESLRALIPSMQARVQGLTGHTYNFASNLQVGDLLAQDVAFAPNGVTAGDALTAIAGVGVTHVPLPSENSAELGPSTAALLGEHREVRLLAQLPPTVKDVRGKVVSSLTAFTSSGWRASDEAPTGRSSFIKDNLKRIDPPRSVRAEIRLDNQTPLVEERSWSDALLIAGRLAAGGDIESWTSRSDLGPQLTADEVEGVYNDLARQDPKARLHVLKLLGRVLNRVDLVNATIAPRKAQDAKAVERAPEGDTLKTLIGKLLARTSAQPVTGLSLQGHFSGALAMRVNDTLSAGLILEGRTAAYPVSVRVIYMRSLTSGATTPWADIFIRLLEQLKLGGAGHKITPSLFIGGQDL